MSKHTPGPWRIEEQVGGWTLEPNVLWLGMVGEGGDILPSDARLIAAAPMLLEALRECIASPSWLDMHDYTTCVDPDTTVNANKGCPACRAKMVLDSVMETK